MRATVAFASDAAMVLGIASTAMPFTRTPEDEAERWLRVLRLSGDVGAALQVLGVSEGRPVGDPEEGGDRAYASASGAATHDAVEQVTEQAARIARERDSAEIGTTDVLMAVICVYGAEFDRVLRAHDVDPDDLIELVGAGRL
jgi:hypothetical protein